MSFTNACFLSYRHVASAPYLTFVRDVYDILVQETEERLGHNAVYLDVQRRQPGQLFNQELASNLCASACMVMVYIPPYFADCRDTSLYCVREYLAMVDFEKRRRLLLPGNRGKATGLIIPIIYKDRGRCPPEILQQRNVMDFSVHERAAKRLTKVREAVVELKAIGAYVVEQFNELQPRGPVECDVCPGYQLPTVERALQWQARLSPPPAGAAIPSPNLPLR